MKFEEFIREQFKEENRGEHICIFPISIISFLACDMANGRFYQFIYNKDEIKEDSIYINLWILELLTREYAVFSVLLEDYSKASSGQNRIVFTEQYINEFNKIEKKEKLFF